MEKVRKAEKELKTENASLTSSMRKFFHDLFATEKPENEDELDKMVKEIQAQESKDVIKNLEKEVTEYKSKTKKKNGRIKQMTNPAEAKETSKQQTRNVKEEEKER